MCVMFLFFFFNDTAPPEIYPLSLHDALPILFDTYDGSPLSSACPMRRALDGSRLKPEHLLILGTRSYNQVELDLVVGAGPDRKSTRLNSSHDQISYAVFCLTQKTSATLISPH